MNSCLIFRHLFAAGFLLFNLETRDAVTPSHWAPWKDISKEYGYATCDDKYRYALKRTLDLIWAVKCHLFDGEFAHELLQQKDGEEINNLTARIQDMRPFLTKIARKVANTLMDRDLESWRRIQPLNQTVINRLLNDWNEMKEIVGQHKPKKAIEEYEKIRKAMDGALREIPERYTPIYELVVKVQNETYLSKETLGYLKARNQVPFMD